MRLFTAIGPGDAVGAHRKQMEGRTDLTETSLTFTGQLFAYCKYRGIDVLAVSMNPRVDTVTDGFVRVEQGPKPLAGQGGMAYHRGAWLYARELARRAAEFRADVAVIDSGTTHYFLLSAFRRLGIPVIVNFHNVMWPQGFPPTRLLPQLVRALDGRFFRRHLAGSLGCSPECGRQVSALAGQSVRYIEWRAQFRREGFPPSPPAIPPSPFRVLFAGRAEEPKGVLDLVAISAALERRHPGQIIFDVCGDGAALPQLRAEVSSRRLAHAITIHGRLERDRLLQIYGASHAVIVPTRGSFGEGMPLVCAEAVISGRPIVTSRLSNALPLLGAAISQAEPEDVGSFVAAIERIAFDTEAYRCHRNVCPALAEQFFRRELSYPAALDQLLAQIFPNWAVEEDWNAVLEPLVNGPVGRVAPEGISGS